MAPTATRSMAKSDPEYCFDRYTPKKRKPRRSVQRETSKKQQKTAREKALQNKRPGLSDPVLLHFGEEHVAGVKECQKNLEDTAAKMLQHAIQIEKFLEADDISENVRGDIEAFCGKAKLLVTSKLQKQFQRMIDDALSPTYTPPTKVSDLAGFWEMVELQVQQSQETYEQLLELQKNGWVVKEEAVKPAPTKVLKQKTFNKPAGATAAKNIELAKARAEKMKLFKAQMKAKREVLAKEAGNDENMAAVQ